jgi:hypothetical protein
LFVSDLWLVADFFRCFVGGDGLEHCGGVGGIFLAAERRLAGDFSTIFLALVDGVFAALDGEAIFVGFFTLGVAVVVAASLVAAVVGTIVSVVGPGAAAALARGWAGAPAMIFAVRQRGGSHADFFQDHEAVARVQQLELLLVQGQGCVADDDYFFPGARFEFREGGPFFVEQIGRHFGENA